MLSGRLSLLLKISAQSSLRDWQINTVPFPALKRRAKIKGRSAAEESNPWRKNRIRGGRIESAAEESNPRRKNRIRGGRIESAAEESNPRRRNRIRGKRIEVENPR